MKLKIFSGSSNLPLAKKICDSLDMELGNLTLKNSVMVRSGVSLKKVLEVMMFLLFNRQIPLLKIIWNYYYC